MNQLVTFEGGRGNWLLHFLEFEVVRWEDGARNGGREQSGLEVGHCQDKASLSLQEPSAVAVAESKRQAKRIWNDH